MPMALKRLGALCLLVLVVQACAALSDSRPDPAAALASAERGLADAKETCRAVFAAAKAAPDAAAQVPQAERDRIVKACEALGVSP